MPKRVRSKRWIWWLVFLVLLIAFGTVCYMIWDNYFNDKKTNTKEEAESTEQIKKDVVENKEKDSEKESVKEIDEKKVIQYEGEDPNEIEELSGSVSYAGILDNRLTIRVNIDQYLGEGNCKLNLVRDNSVEYSEMAKIVSSVSTATCEGFDIPVSQLSTGNYKIEVNLNSGEKSGLIRGEINI